MTQPPSPRINLTSQEMIGAVSRKKIYARTTMMNTITVVIVVSLRLVQVTLLVSCRTCRMNWAGLVLLIRRFVSSLDLFQWPVSAVARIAKHRKVAGVAGLEPPAPGFGARCSTN